MNTSGHDADFDDQTFERLFTEPNPAPPQRLIERVVIHAIAEYIEDDRSRVWPVWDYLEYRGLSCHFLVMPSGVVIRGRRCGDVAWHAKGFNLDSYGVEVVVPGLHNYGSFLRRIHEADWVTDAAYAAVVETARRLCHRSGLSADALVRHSDIDPSRKQDPGHGFPWDPFVTDVRAELEGEAGT